MIKDPIVVGDEVFLCGVRDIVAVVTLNTAEHFCTITKDGMVYDIPKEFAHPVKTGRHFDVGNFLKMIF